MSTSYKFANGDSVAVSFTDGNRVTTKMFMTVAEFENNLSATVFEFGISNVGSLLKFVQDQEQWGPVIFND